MDFAAALRAARLDRKLTMRDAAEQTGIFLPIYKMIEAGKIAPDRDKMRVLCAFFGVDIQDSVE